MKNQIRTLEITDVLDYKSKGKASVGVKVRGMVFDAQYCVVLKQEGRSSAFIEIDSAEIGPISVLVDGNYLLLDQTQLKNGNRSLYNDIITALDEEAVIQALSVPDYKWNYEDIEGV